MRGHAGSATSQYDNNKKITKDGLRNVLKLFGYIKPYQIEYSV